MADFTICGRLRAQQLLADKHTFSHVISFRDRGSPLLFGLRTVPKRLELEVDDVSLPRGGYRHFTEADLLAILRFGESMEPTSDILAHCEQGISRSTAAVYVILCHRLGPGQEERALQRVLRARDVADPNTLLVQLADEHLKRRGAMLRQLGILRGMRGRV